MWLVWLAVAAVESQLVPSASAAGAGDVTVYGPVTISVTSIVECRGPRVRNCSTCHIEHAPGSGDVTFTLNVTEDISPNMGKATTINQQNPNSQILRLQMNKPCEHIFVRPILDKFFNPSSTCLVKKGIYTFRMEMDRLFDDYLGGKFFYGNYTFKTVIVSKTCNFSCTKIDVSIKPKNAI